MNFLYCIDENYNFQCYISICSLIKFTKQDLEIHIIHKDPSTFLVYSSKIQNKYDNVKISIYKFTGKIPSSHSMDPKKDKHLSEATYYRLYISDYLSSEIENITYIDADVFAVNNFNEILKNTYKELSDSSYIIGAYDVVNYNKGTKFKPYFNVGVLLINYKRWIDNDISGKLQDDFNKNPNLKYHDQDLLNNFFNEDFINLQSSLNEHITLDDKVIKAHKEELSKRATFVHYVGARKPWDYDGMVQLSSYFYHSLIQEFNNGKLNLEKKKFLFLIKFTFQNINKLVFNNYSGYYFKNIFTQIKS